MFNLTLQATFLSGLQDLPELLLRKVYFFHDVQVTCHTNHAEMFALLDELLGVFQEPEQLRGEVDYAIVCYEDAWQFTVQLPRSSKHTETIRLITDTKLRYYVSSDYSTEYHSYAELPMMNGPVLSVIRPHECVALTQLEAPEKYRPGFLRRCVFLMTLGQLMRHLQFEPCHAAAIAAPAESALIFGASGSGKTTLSLGCALAGYGLLGDDLVMLRENGADDRISAYVLMPEVSVRTGTIELLHALAFLKDFPADTRGKRHCMIEQIRPGALRLQAPVSLLVFPMLVAAGESSITRLSKARTLQELVQHCMRVEKTYPQSQERLFSLLSKLAEQAPGYQLVIARDALAGPLLLHTLFAGGSNG